LLGGYLYLLKIIIIKSTTLQIQNSNIESTNNLPSSLYWNEILSYESHSVTSNGWWTDLTRRPVGDRLQDKSKAFAFATDLAAMW